MRRECVICIMLSVLGLMIGVCAVLAECEGVVFYEDFTDISDWKEYGGWWGKVGLIGLSKDVYVSPPSSLHIKTSLAEAAYVFRKVPVIDFKKAYTVILWVYISSYSDNVKVYSDSNVVISILNNTLMVLKERPKTFVKVLALEYKTWYEVVVDIDPVTKVATVRVGGVSVTSSIPKEGISTSNPYASWDIMIGDGSHHVGKGDIYVDDLKIIQAGAFVEEGVLEIVVKDSDTGEPIQNATIVIDGLTGVTNSTGGLRVSLRAGTYTVSVTALGYYPATEKIEVKAGEKTLFELRLYPLFDFKLSIEPASVKMKQGETKEVIIKVKLVKGIGRPVKLYVLGLPEKASCTISPQEVVPPAKAKLTIEAGAAKGKFKVTIKGVSYGKVRTVTLDLVIEEKRCIIATVTYGSELAEVVDFLRGFRDNIVLSTYAGRSFYVAFDLFYYSWSPSVAQVIHENSWLKPMFRLLLYPLIYSLRVATFVVQPLISVNGEVAVFIAGAIASFLIGVIYLAPLMYVVLRRRDIAFSLRTLGLAIVTVLFVSLIAEFFRLDWLLTVTTSMYVLLLVSLGAVLPLRLIRMVSKEN